MLQFAAVAPRIALPSCARCGAPLPVAPGEERPRCTYCGARSVVERDHQGRSDPYPVGPRDLAALGKVLWIPLVAVGLSAVMSIVGVLAHRVHLPRKLAADVAPPIHDPSAAPAGNVPRKDEPAPAPLYPTRVLAGLLLDDVDRDGTEDVVGAFENETPAGEQWLGALSGIDGHEILGPSRQRGDGRRGAR